MRALCFLTLAGFAALMGGCAEAPWNDPERLVAAAGALHGDAELGRTVPAGVGIQAVVVGAGQHQVAQVGPRRGEGRGARRRRCR